MKSVTLKEFQKTAREAPNVLTIKKSSTVVDGIAELAKFFSLQCKYCGSNDILLIGEDGIDYGGYTGYSSGCNVIKCKSCGNAVTIYA